MKGEAGPRYEREKGGGMRVKSVSFGHRVGVGQTRLCGDNRGHSGRGSLARTREKGRLSV